MKSKKIDKIDKLIILSKYTYISHAYRYQFHYQKIDKLII